MSKMSATLAVILLAVLPLGASTQTASAPASSGAKESFGMVVKKGINESGGSFFETV